MAYPIRIYFALALQLLLLFLVTSAFSQVDPGKILIGTWEGQAEISVGQTGRTLVITSVKAASEGAWTAKGRFGISGVSTAPGGRDMDVTVKDNEIYLDFIVGTSRNPVHLKVVGENKLEGTISMPMPGGQRAQDRRISFQKVELKSGEAK